MSDGCVQRKSAQARRAALFIVQRSSTREAVGPYRGGAILPTTWTPGSIPGVGLRTTTSA